MLYVRIMQAQGYLFCMAKGQHGMALNPGTAMIVAASISLMYRMEMYQYVQLTN